MSQHSRSRADILLDGAGRSRAVPSSPMELVWMDLVWKNCWRTANLEVRTLGGAGDTYDDSCIYCPGERVIEGSMSCNIHLQGWIATASKELVVVCRSYSTFLWNRGPRPCLLSFPSCVEIFHSQPPPHNNKNNNKNNNTSLLGLLLDACQLVVNLLKAPGLVKWKVQERSQIEPVVVGAVVV